MLSKKEIKDIQSLGHKKHRDEAGLFIAEGVKTVSELLKEKNASVKAVYATENWLNENSHLYNEVMKISETELERISQLKDPNKVLAVLHQFTTREPSSEGFTIYLDRIQDPGNFGTIIRIADWFNIKNVVCSAGCADLYNPKVVQATMASIARVNVYYDQETNWLAKQSVRIYAAVLDGKPVYNFQKIKEGVVLIGNESKGISEDLLQLEHEKITIPRQGNAESLNAAVATGIILSHLI
ncbi:MAG TPA: RNA methyltransferase [Flavisolibacter sp.]|jgi:TrmH family RNA methyltransferase|nr:RNA methyltransferase [Flavisolibacter sp.]